MMLSSRLRLGMFALCAMLPLAAPEAKGGEPGCPVAEDAFTFEPYLPKTLKALQGDAVMTVVAVGGASTEGRAAGGPDASWPSRFVERLKERFPAAAIKLVVHAVARQTTAQMAARFGRDVLPLKPTLVIWETGTTDAVRGTDIDEFRETLVDGIEVLKEHGVEVALMDMQFSPLAQTIDFFNRYVVIMRGVADVNDIPLFPRFRIMYDWSEMGLLDRTTNTPEARRALADKLYRCLGSAVADFVTRQPEGSTDPK